jgi:CO/xanthine dehydrogenase Mo-binding subunit
MQPGRGRKQRHACIRAPSPFYTGPLRSPLRIQNTFVKECFMDELAAASNADPVEYRLRYLSNERLRGVVEAAAKAAGGKNGQPTKDLPQVARRQ